MKTPFIFYGGAQGLVPGMDPEFPVKERKLALDGVLRDVKKMGDRLPALPLLEIAEQLLVPFRKRGQIALLEWGKTL